MPGNGSSDMDAASGPKTHFVKLPLISVVTGHSLLGVAGLYATSEGRGPSKVTFGSIANPPESSDCCVGRPTTIEVRLF